MQDKQKWRRLDAAGCPHWAGWDNAIALSFFGSLKR